MSTIAQPGDYTNFSILDSSEKEETYLLTLSNHTYLKCSPLAYRLIQGRQAGDTYEELAPRLSEQYGKRISATELEKLHRHLLDQIEKLEKSPQPKRPFLFLMTTLLSRKIVQSIASLLKILFRPALLGISIAGIALAFLYALFPPAITFHVSYAGFFWALALCTISLLFHEFGHAAACSAYGARPGSIGFAFFLIWPVFYSNVSDIWRLTRKQRVLVDLGGVFFQLLTGAGFIILYKLTRWEPFNTSVFMIVGSCLFTLNPIFRFDGYWVVSDVLGVVNLNQQKSRILLHFFQRLLKRQTKPLPWPTKTVNLLFVFSIVSFAVWGYFMVQLVPIFADSLSRYPELLQGLIQVVLDPPEFVDKRRLLVFVSMTYILLIPILMLAPILKWAYASIRKTATMTRDQTE